MRASVSPLPAKKPFIRRIRLAVSVLAAALLAGTSLTGTSLTGTSLTGTANAASS